MTEQQTFGNGEVQQQPGTDNQQPGGQQASFDQGSANQQPTAPQQQPPQNQDANLRQQISVLEKRLQDKDTFIETLKNERKDDSSTINNLKEQVEQLEQKSKSVEEVLERLKASQGGQDADGNRLTPEEAKRMAEDVYQQHRTQETRQANFNSVKQELLDRYGNEKVDSQVAETAQGMGMTFDEAFQMAETRPAVFRKLFIGDAPAKTSDPAGPQGSVNTQALGNGEQPPKPKPFVNMKSDKDRISAIQARMKNYST